MFQGDAKQKLNLFGTCRSGKRKFLCHRQVTGISNLEVGITSFLSSSRKANAHFVYCMPHDVYPKKLEKLVSCRGLPMLSEEKSGWVTFSSNKVQTFN